MDNNYIDVNGVDVNVTGVCNSDPAVCQKETNNSYYTGAAKLGG